MAHSCDIQQVLFIGCNRQPSYVTSCSSLVTAENLKEGEILVKTVSAAICPSDLEKLDTKQLGQELPSGFGHEGVGEIVTSKRIPLQVDEPEFKPGDRILFCSSQCLDHNNDNKNNLESTQGVHLHSAASYDSKNAHFGGTFSTHCILKNNVHIIKLPDNVPPEIGAIMNCPFASMTCALEALHLQKSFSTNEAIKVAIIKGATVGSLYSCALLREKQFEHVIVIDKNQCWWSIIERFGGLPTLSLSGNSQVEEILQNHRVQIIIDTNTSKKFLSEGLELICTGGIYIVASTTNCDVLHIPAEILIQKSLIVRGVNGYGARHFKKAVDFISKTINKYPYNNLVSKPFKFSQFNDAITFASQKNLQRVIVQPN